MRGDQAGSIRGLASQPHQTQQPWNPHNAVMPDSLNTAQLERLVRLAKLLDSKFRIPFTTWHFGIDAIIGLIPGVGDLITAALSLIIVHQAWKSGVRKETLTRMIIYVAIDLVVGAIPVAGDIFDAAFKANVMNVKLLQHELETRGGTVELRKVVVSKSR